MSGKNEQKKHRMPMAAAENDPTRLKTMEKVQIWLCKKYTHAHIRKCSRTMLIKIRKGNKKKHSSCELNQLVMCVLTEKNNTMNDFILALRMTLRSLL